jgi:transposase-like protein
MDEISHEIAQKGPLDMAPGAKRRRYDDQFKREAVKALLESGKPVTTVASVMGIDQSNLHKWKKIFGPEIAGAARNPAAAAGACLPGMDDLDTLKRELASVKETVDQLRTILNKTLRERYIPRV